MRSDTEAAILKATKALKQSADSVNELLDVLDDLCRDRLKETHGKEESKPEGATASMSDKEAS